MGENQIECDQSRPVGFAKILGPSVAEVVVMNHQLLQILPLHLGKQRGSLPCELIMGDIQKDQEGPVASSDQTHRLVSQIQPSNR